MVIFYRYTLPELTLCVHPFAHYLCIILHVVLATHIVTFKSLTPTSTIEPRNTSTTMDGTNSKLGTITWFGIRWVGR
jgi:hypothetical protein